MRREIAISTAMLAASAAAFGSVTTYFDDKAGWTGQAGPSTKLDFIGSENGQLIPFDWFSQYGITLASQYHPNAASWSLLVDPATLDGWSTSTATNSSTDTLAVNFWAPQHAFAYEEWAGWGEAVGVSFYLQGQLVATSFQSPPFFPGNAVHFYGWVTDFAFDRVVLSGSDRADNMYIVPGPGVISLLPLWWVARRRRSRCPPRM